MALPLFDPDSVGPEQDAAERDKNKEAEESVGALILRLRKYNGADNGDAGNPDPQTSAAKTG